MKKESIYHYYVEGDDEKSASKKEYKSDINNCSNLGARLNKCHFDISKFWSRFLQNEFCEFGNDAEKIKNY